MVGWHHWLNGHEFKQALGESEEQGSLACYSPWGDKELDTTQWLNNGSLRAHRQEVEAAIDNRASEPEKTAVANTRGPRAHGGGGRCSRDHLSLEAKGCLPGEESAELAPKDKLWKPRWEGGRTPGEKMPALQRHRHQREPCRLRRNIRTVAPHGFQNLQPIILLILSGRKTPSSVDLTFWSSQNHWELSHMSKLGNWDGVSILRQKRGEREAKIMEIAFLCNSQPDLKNSFLLKEQKGLHQQWAESRQ